MQSDISAGVELLGSALRYAEVEHYGERARLLRLGSCAFEYDLTRDLRDAAPERLNLLREALEDVFAGSKASRLRVAVHPPVGCYFFTALPSGLSNGERQAHLRQQADFLMGNPGWTPFIQGELLYSESQEDEPVDWYQALVFAEDVYAPYAGMLGELSFGAFSPTVSMHAAAAVLRHKQDEGSLFTLAVGAYPSHVEFTLCRGPQWRFAHHAPAGPPEDCAYYAAALLNRLRMDADAIERLYVYGEDADATSFDAVSDVLSAPAEKLDAFRVIDHSPEGLSEDVRGEEYVIAIGAALC